MKTKVSILCFFVCLAQNDGAFAKVMPVEQSERPYKTLQVEVNERGRAYPYRATVTVAVGKCDLLSVQVLTKPFDDADHTRVHFVQMQVLTPAINCGKSKRFETRTFDFDSALDRAEFVIPYYANLKVELLQPNEEGN